MTTNNIKTREHFQNEWVRAQPWVKKVDGGFMPMVGCMEANYKTFETEGAAMEKAIDRRKQLIEMWK